MKCFKVILFFVLFVVTLHSYSQKYEFGIKYSPLLISKITFDKKYIIYNDFGSTIAGDNKFHLYFTGISLGLFYKEYFNKINYFQAEINFNGNNFGNQIPDWASSRKKNFTYSTIDIPLLIGITLNRGRKIKLNLFGGINNKFGRFITTFYSSFSYLINDNMNNEYYYADKKRKRELINKFKFYYVNPIIGLSISKFGSSIALSFEKNIYNLNKVKYDYNANFKDLYLIRISLLHKIQNKNNILK